MIMQIIFKTFDMDFFMCKKSGNLSVACTMKRNGSTLWSFLTFVHCHLVKEENGGEADQDFEVCLVVH